MPAIGKAAVLAAILAAGYGLQAQEEPSPTTTTASAPAMPAGVDLAPHSIVEQRSAYLVSPAPKWTILPELKLIVHVVGDTAVKASRFGRLKLDEAVDDTGESLLKTETSLVRRPREALETIDEWKRRDVRNGFSLELRLQPAARKAAKIARINGSFVLMVGGKPVEVIIKSAAALAGKEVEDAVLAAAGIKVKIDNTTEAGKQIAFVIEGNEDAVRDAELVDESGRQIRSIKNTSRMGDGPTLNTLAAQSGKMPETAGLKLSILSGAKFITVPIALRDLPLP